MKRLLAGVALACVAVAGYAQLNGGIMDSQKQGTAAITAGAINGATIGATTPSTGSFTTLFSTGQALVGTTSAQAVSGAVVPLWQLHGTTAGGARMSVTRWTNGAGVAANINCANSRGAVIGTHSVSLALDPICQFMAMGDDGTNFQNSSSITFSIDNGTVSATSMPGKIVLATAPNTTVAPVAALTLDMAQNATFGGEAISSKFRSTAAKVLLQGTGTGPTQIASTQTTVPTCTSNCGTSPAVAGSDSDGIVTMGSSGVPASGWVVTFNGTWAAAPSCIVQSALTTMVVGKMPIAVQTSTTTMTVTTNGTAPSTSDKYAYHCRGTS